MSDSKNMNIMQTKNYLYFALAALLLIASCKKSFLDQVPPNGVPVATSIETDNDLADAVNGMYVDMKVYEFFGRDCPVLGDLLADNTYVSSTNSGRYLSESNYSFISTTAEASDMWDYGYTSILQANRIISSGVPADSNSNELIGEAYIARGLMYLELVNYYATPYTVNPSAPGVPLVTISTANTGAFIKPARSTVAQIYAQIISDLDSAYLIMPVSSTTLHAINSDYLCKWAAKAIEARAYLYEGDYANARDAALIVVQNGGYTLATTASAFASYWASPDAVANKLETIFELNMNASSNNGFNGLDAIYDPGAYGDILATDSLYDDYTSTDMRQALMIPAVRGGYPVHQVNKYQNIANTDRDEVKIIRYAEVVLTLAEGYAQTGDDADAQKYVNLLAQLRDPAFGGYTSTGAQLVSDIIDERRKESAFEGLRWFDLMRINAVVNRPQDAGSYPSYPTVSLTDIRRLFPIPQSELTANPNMVQNPGY